MNAEKIRSLFHENFAERGELGAAVSVWQDGEEVLSLVGGFRDRHKTLPWLASTPVLVWSGTKGPSSACVLHALHARGASLQSPVAVFWPEFAQAGKGEITVGQFLSHQSGLAAFDREVPASDYAAVIAALEQQAPLWREGHGYEPRTFGWLLDELVRRLAGVPLGDYWHTHFAERWALDFWIGAPREKVQEIATIVPPKLTGTFQNDAFYDAFSDPATLTARAFSSPRGLHAVAAMNTPEARMAQYPAFGGIGTASAFAKFYDHLLREPYVDWAITPLVSGLDRVLLRETTFSAGFMKSKALFGSESAFGHAGAGGSVAFADPASGLSFAYVMNQMEQGVLPNEKSLRLIRALYE